MLLFWFLVEESGNGVAEFVCIVSMIPVVVDVFFPDIFFVFLYLIVYLLVDL